MASKSLPSDNILGLDVGEARIGVAISSTIAKLPRPLAAIRNDSEIYKNIIKVIAAENTILIVVGLPRNQEGQETKQSAKVRAFAAGLEEAARLPVEFADESLSSVRAEEALSKQKNQSVSADSVAACLILEEYFINS